jgi:hypothetical protein
MISPVGAAVILGLGGVASLDTEGGVCPGARLPSLVSSSTPCLGGLGISAATLNNFQISTQGEKKIDRSIVNSPKFLLVLLLFIVIVGGRHDNLPADS